MQRVLFQAREGAKSKTRKLAIFVVTTNVPNSIVENLAFKDLLNPKYIVSSRTVISIELENVYIELKAKMSCFIQVIEEANRIQLTCGQRKVCLHLTWVLPGTFFVEGSSKPLHDVGCASSTPPPSTQL